jgi:hypothetical protein
METPIVTPADVQPPTLIVNRCTACATNIPLALEGLKTSVEFSQLKHMLYTIAGTWFAAGICVGVVLTLRASVGVALEIRNKA